MAEYKPYGKEWEKEMAKLTKTELTGLFRASARNLDLYVEETNRLREALREILEYPEERASYDIAEKVLGEKEVGT